MTNKVSIVTLKVAVAYDHDLWVSPTNVAEELRAALYSVQDEFAPEALVINETVISEVKPAGHLTSQVWTAALTSDNLTDLNPDEREDLVRDLNIAIENICSDYQVKF